MATTSAPSIAPLLPDTIPTTALDTTSRPPPRPLHLLIPPPPATAPSIPQTAPIPSASTFSPTSDAPRCKAARRQSSISYRPPDSQPLWSPRRTGSLPEGPSNKKRASLPAPAKPQTTPATALTLAEKHADLLHFIAQKESKCLDLRAQLAVHEAELLQLKKKWERIVARDFGRAQAPPSIPVPAPAPAPSTAPATGGNPMLDSLGRLFAAGLAPAPSAAVRPSPFASASATRHRITASSASSSHATTSTAASSGDRLSQSSVSSVGSVDERVRRRRSGSPSALLGDLEMEQGQAEQGLQWKAKRASMPPQGVGSGVGVGMSAWMGAGRRKLEELREGETFARSQKRASVLLSDVSQSIFSVLSPGTPTTPALTASASLLDDDDPDEGLGGVLVPDALVPAPKSPMKAAKTSAVAAQTQEDDDDDEWNW